MNASLRALLAGSIDYAGMFPPAGLTLTEAIDRYRQYRGSQASWMLGRFVVPAAQNHPLTEELLDAATITEETAARDQYRSVLHRYLGTKDGGTGRKASSHAPASDLASIYDSETDGRLIVIVPGAGSGAGVQNDLDQILAHITKSPLARAVDMLEFRWPAEFLQDANDSRLGNLVQTAADQIVSSRLTPMTMFFELPRPKKNAVGGAHDAVRNCQIRAAVDALAEYNQAARSLNCPAGFKLRCGGTAIGEIPSSAEVADAICACRDRGVFWKATAGLHHPLRHTDPVWRVSVHGFLNLMSAAVLADVHHLDERQTQAVIDENDPRQFGFSDEALTWSEYSVPAEQIATARGRSFRSFGSCSFDEPCDDLKVLGLM